MNPPPLSVRPPPLPGPRPDSPYAQPAALLSLIVPILAILAAGAITGFSLSAPVTPAAKAGAVVVALLGALVGLVAGITTLCCQPRRNVLAQGSIGMALSFVLMATVAFGLMAAERQKAIKQRETAKRIRALGRDFQAENRKNFNSQTGLTNGADQVERFRQQLDDTSHDLSGNDAQVMAALSTHLARVQAGLKNYEAAVAVMREVKPLGLATLTNQNLFPERRETVREFLRRNEELKVIFRDAETNLRADLENRKLPPVVINSAIAGYHRSAAPKNAFVAQIRDYDTVIGESSLQMLTVLETQWGHWSYDDLLEKVTFADPEARKTYTAAQKALQTAAQKQVEAQRRLVNLPDAAEE